MRIQGEIELGSCTVKKVRGFPGLQPGCHLPNSPWPGIIKLFPPRESLVSDIPTGDGKTANLLLQCEYSRENRARRRIHGNRKGGSGENSRNICIGRRERIQGKQR